jgi:hypothetical protein
VPSQIGEHTCEIRRSKNGVEVCVEDNPGMACPPCLLTTVFEGLHNGVAPCCRVKNGKPAHGSPRDEMSELMLEDAIAAAHGEPLSMTKHSFEDKGAAFPNATWNEGFRVMSVVRSCLDLRSLQEKACRLPTTFRIQRACPDEPSSYLPTKSMSTWGDVRCQGQRGRF